MIDENMMVCTLIAFNGMMHNQYKLWCIKWVQVTLEQLRVHLLSNASCNFHFTYSVMSDFDLPFLDNQCSFKNSLLFCLIMNNEYFFSAQLIALIRVGILLVDSQFNYMFWRITAKAFVCSKYGWLHASKIPSDTNIYLAEIHCLGNDIIFLMCQ